MPAAQSPGRYTCAELDRADKMIVKAHVFAITSAAYILVMDKLCGASRKPRKGLPPKLQRIRSATD